MGYLYCEIQLGIQFALNDAFIYHILPKIFDSLSLQVRTLLCSICDLYHELVILHLFGILIYVPYVLDLGSDGLIGRNHSLIRPDDSHDGLRGLKLEQDVTLSALVDNLNLRENLPILFVLSEDDCLMWLQSHILT